MPYNQQPHNSALASNVPTTKILFSRLSIVVLQAPRCGDESNVIQKKLFTINGVDYKATHGQREPSAYMRHDVELAGF
jgi:hypothetical protein